LKTLKYNYLKYVYMSSFEKKKLENGDKNPKYVDLCDEDQSIAGQKFTCLSFVSPEKILKKREVYLFDQFIKNWEFSKSMERYFDFIHFIAYKHNLSILNRQPKLRVVTICDHLKNAVLLNTDYNLMSNHF